MRESMVSQCRSSRRRFLQRTGMAGLLFFGGIPSWLGKRHSRFYVERSFHSMGSIAFVCAYGESRSQLQHATTKIIEEFQRLDNLLSVYKPDSSVSVINAAAGKRRVVVEPEILELLESALRYNRITAGAFDVTVEPLMRLWGFREDSLKRGKIPSDKEIKAALEAVGMGQVEPDYRGRTVGLKNHRSRLDFGGIAVGYAIDRAVSILKSEGVVSAFINHSGDAYALGSPEDSVGWAIAIPDPLDSKQMLTTLGIQDQAVSTSGSYEKYVVIDEARYGHILDPATGFPSDGMLSATILAPSSLQADVLSTGCYALGAEKASSVVGALPGVGLLSVGGTGSKLKIRREGSWTGHVQ